ncbi:MAG: hydroxylamine oxidoreductase [Chlorobi bacterium]|nr:hydroxylamine oxidoreductase [Chlorobiota bacterium]
MVFFSFFLLSAWRSGDEKKQNHDQHPEIDAETAQCIACHGQHGRGKSITEQWKLSKHAQAGVGCLACHQADTEDVDGFKHEGYLIATIVTPKDCGQCHTQEVEEFTHSHHADAGLIMGSLDNVLAEVVEGHTDFNNGANPAAASGCWQCHGSRVAIQRDKDGQPQYDEHGVLILDPKTWPNTGIGRVNLDGSKGSCSACHNRHRFSVNQVRQPENCGKCHLGPDHPQLEIYQESKHGINFYAHKAEMNLDAQPWVVGEDYFAAPTCATCHMSATPDQPVTHDVGDRISWTLRPKVSEKIDAGAIAQAKASGNSLPADFLTWEQRRSNMQNVCHQCHSKGYVESFYSQYDNQVELYNEKFGKPALQLITELRKNGLLTPASFDEKIEWTYFYLWHHEGRRARMGAAMMGPDYTQWHGNFEVAERFYMELVPEIQELIHKTRAEGKTDAAGKVQARLDEILNSDLHKWFIGKMSPEEIKRRKEAAEQFRKRYSR